MLESIQSERESKIKDRRVCFGLRCYRVEEQKTILIDTSTSGRAVDFFRSLDRKDLGRIGLSFRSLNPAENYGTTIINGPNGDLHIEGDKGNVLKLLEDAEK